ncbi:MAG: hypothetical protein L6Q99_09795 [Planctomycetes bacterium]|nr:hypothetical protein [Planctomycetota bacterium]
MHPLLSSVWPAAVACGALARAPQGEPPREQRSAQEHTLDQRPEHELTLDERIDALPPIGCHHHRDPASGKWSDDPIAAGMRPYVEARALSDEQWRRALVKSGAIRWPKRWVEGAPLLLSLRIPSWIPAANLTVTPRVAELDYAFDSNGIPVCGMFDPEAGPSFWWQGGKELGLVPAGTRAIACDVSIEKSNIAFSRRKTGDGRLWLGTLELDVEWVKSVDDIVVPVSGPEFDAVVRRALKLTIVETSVPDPASSDEYIEALAAEVELRVDEHGPLALLETSVALEFVLLRDGQEVGLARAVPIALADLRHPAHPGRPAPRGFVVRESVDALPLDTSRDPERYGHWAVRVRGDGIGALALWDAKRYWKGELTLPLADALAAYERERSRR